MTITTQRERGRLRVKLTDTGVTIKELYLQIQEISVYARYCLMKVSGLLEYSGERSVEAVERDR